MSEAAVSTRAPSASEERPRWCRLSLVVALVPPAHNQVLKIERGPRSMRVTVCAPKAVVIGATVAFLGNQPWVVDALRWVLALVT